MIYLGLKTLHIISSTLLFGTGLGSAYYMYRAHLSGNVHSIVYASRACVFADWVFTTPAVIIQPISGIWMAHLVGYSLMSPWLLYSIILYMVIGACWLPVVWLQIKANKLAEYALQHNETLPPLYYRIMRYWLILGWPAFIGVLIIFYLMVFKPS